MNPLKIARSVSLALALAAPIAACSGSDPADEETAPDTERDPETLPSRCFPPTAGPTMHHSGAIEVDETWTADAGPHIVDGFIAVRGGATLTIEPCATVQFTDEYAGLTIAYPGSPTTGSLVAEGEPDATITFEGKDGARWGHVLVEAGGTARLAHLTLDRGGGYDARGASLIVHGDGTLPTRRDVLASELTIRRSRGVGVVLDRLGAFADASTGLTVTESGSDDTLPYPVLTDEHGLHTLPRGAYTGNLVDKIHVDPESHLAEDATIKDLGVPYLIGTFPEDDFVVGAGSDATPITLRIEPGVRLEMHPGTAFMAEFYTGPFPASGAIVAEGTAEKPIVFTSAAATPAPGDWRGLWFGGVARADNSFRHVRLEHTGADCGCILIGCSAIEGYEGAIIFSEQPPAPFFEDTVIAHASGNGVVLGYRGTVVDVASGITFEDVAGCPQTLPHPGSCPDPLPACQ